MADEGGKVGDEERSFLGFVPQVIEYQVSWEGTALKNMAGGVASNATLRTKVIVCFYNGVKVRIKAMTVTQSKLAKSTAMDTGECTIFRVDFGSVAVQDHVLTCHTNGSGYS
jgi:hypothetical protein